VVVIFTKLTSVLMPDIVTMLTKSATVPMLNVAVIFTKLTSVLMPDIVTMLTKVATVPMLNVVFIFTKVTSVLERDKVTMFTTVASVPLLNMVAMFTKATNVFGLLWLGKRARSVSFRRRFLSCFVKRRGHWQLSRPPSLNSRRRPLIFFPPPRVGFQRVPYPVGTGRSIPRGKVAGA